MTVGPFDRGRKDTMAGTTSVKPSVGTIEDLLGRAPTSALRAVGVDTVAKLARAKPDALARRLADAGIQRAPTTVERWVREARQHLGPATPAQAASRRPPVPADDDNGRIPPPPEELLQGLKAGPGCTVWFLTPSSAGGATTTAGPVIVYSERGAGENRRFEPGEDWAGWVRSEGTSAPLAAPQAPTSTVTVSSVSISRRAGMPPAVVVEVAFTVRPVPTPPTVRVIARLDPTDAGGAASTGTVEATVGDDGKGLGVCLLSFPALGEYRATTTVLVGTAEHGPFPGPNLTITA